VASVRSSRPRARASLAALGAVLLLGLLSAGTGAHAATHAAGTHAAGTLAAPGPIVLIGTGGVRWNDVDSSLPSLYSFVNSGSSGWLAVRSVRSTTCPADGWLAVSAGRRASDTPTGPAVNQKTPACRTLGLAGPSTGGAAAVPRWSDYLAQARDGSFDATPGLLADTLAAAGIKAVAVGPGAAIALARSSGRADHVYATAPGDTGGAPDQEALANDVAAALAATPQVLVIDAGAIRDPAQAGRGEPAPAGAAAQPLRDQVIALETRLTPVLSQLPPSATVILASLADTGRTSQLQLLGASGPGVIAGGAFTGSLLGSASTRQDGLAQSTDLLPTLLRAVGVTVPDDAVGSPLRPVAPGGSAADRLQQLDDLDRAARAVHPIVPWFFNGFVVAQILLYGLITIVLRRRSGHTDSPGGGPQPAIAHLRARTLTWMRVLTVVFACVPAATYLANLVPWWRASTPGLAVTGAVLAFVVPLAAIALLGPWRRAFLGPMGAAGAVTALVLAGDVLTGSHLMLSSLMGVQPVVAGRFYGFSNPGFALFATGALLAAMAVADALTGRGQRRAAVWAVAVIAVLAVVIDGTPGLGSDFGGPPAIIPAFAVLGLMIAGVKVDLRRALLIAAVTIGVLVALSVLDWLRPAADRTHLGRFVQTVIDGGAWSVIQRKGEQNLQILFTSWLSALLPLAVAFVVLVLSRPVSWGARPLQLAYTRSPVLKQGVIAFGVMIFLGFALNDSGTAVPAVAATLAIPLLISVSARALQLHDADELDAAIATARKPKQVRR
jgi:hypothetical protein